MDPVGPSEWLWKEGGGFYTEKESDLREKPSLPDERYVRDQRLMRLFREHGRVSPGAEVLEIGCGRSSWLPYLGHAARCHISGIEIEPHAASLARANLAGAGVDGRIYCRDGFDLDQNADLWGRFDLVYSLGVIEHLEHVSDKLRILARYLKPDGRLISVVPNLRGLNWVLQRCGSLAVLQAHVLYTTRTLRRVHEEAGFETVTTEYLGFFDGLLTLAAGESALRQALHGTVCRLLHLSSVAWSRAGFPTPEWPWTAPLVVYAGMRSAEQKTRPPAIQSTEIALSI